MNTVLRSRLLNTVVLLLLVFNLLAIGIFWWQKWKDAPPNQKNEGASAFLIEQLQFDSAQLIAFKQLQQVHQQKIRNAKDSMRMAKDRFFDLIDQDSASEAALKLASTNAAEKQIQLDRITFQFFKDVQALCNAEQKVKFKQVIREALRIMGRPGPPPHNGSMFENNRPDDRRPDGPPPPEDESNHNRRPPPPRD
ncbi:MAG: hypothetical protein NTZ19_11215 [Bacteroidetes bacterium]|nr:hypothetical protein [Bacteroidota bacterium]